VLRFCSRFTIPLSAVAVLLGLAAGASAAQWYKDYEDGIDAFKDGRFQEAVNLLEKAIRSGPEPGRVVFYGTRVGCFYPHYYVGKSYAELSNWVRARESLLLSESSGELQDKPELAQDRRQTLLTLRPDIPRPTTTTTTTTTTSIYIASPVPPPVLGTYHALLIAVERYEHVPSLKNPISDANKIRQLLTERYTFEPRNVQLLANPTRAGVLDTLDTLRARLQVNDNLLIFYAGHGYWDRDEREGSWLPTDSTSERSANRIPNSEIVAKIRAIKTRHTLLISDACFGGSIFQEMRDASTAPPSVVDIYRNRSRKAITSGTKEQQVPDRSVFLEYVTRRLLENEASFLTARTLHASLYEAVRNNSPSLPEYGTIQGADDEGLGGDFIFVLRRKN